MSSMNINKGREPFFKWVFILPEHVAQPVEGQFEDSEISSATLSTSSHQYQNESPLPQPQANSEQHTNATQRQPAQNHSASAPSKPVMSVLNPHSKEFVPQTHPMGSGLNIGAVEFVPQGLLKAGTAQPQSMPLEEEPQNELLSISDILQGYERRHKTDTSLLTAIATMLLEVTTYPGTYDMHAQVLTRIVLGCSPVEDELLDLAEMLLVWVR